MTVSNQALLLLLRGAAVVAGLVGLEGEEKKSNGGLALFVLSDWGRRGGKKIDEGGVAVESREWNASPPSLSGCFFFFLLGFSCNDLLLGFFVFTPL